jgi:hypothetical protein
MESLKPSIRVRRILWGTVIFLALIGVFVVVRRMAHLVPILINGHGPPTAPSNPTLVRFVALDDVFARYPVLTLVHILPGLLFVVLGPLQFSSTFRKRHLHWERPHFIPKRHGDWPVCAGHELCDAVYRRRQSSSGNDLVWLVVFVRARQSVSTYSERRNAAAPRMDDSRFLNRSGCRHHSSYHRCLLRH